MRNSQLAVLCGTIVVAALIVVGGNAALVRSLRGGGPAAAPAGGPPPARPVTIAMMPKNTGDPYFVACHGGAEAAAKELGVRLLWDGPATDDAAKQNELVDTWVTRGVDAIAVSVNDGDALSTALAAARAKGIKVVTWDADAHPDARDFFVNQATPQGIGTALMDDAAAALPGGGRTGGQFAIVTDTMTSPNQNQWMTWVEKRRAEKYPDVKRVAVEPCGGNQGKAYEVTKTILNANPGVTVVMAIAAPAMPGAAEAVKQSGRADVHVVGLGTPNDSKPYVHAGITTAVVLWNTTDLGYLAVEAADAVAKGTLGPGDRTFHAGRLGDVKIVGTDVMLGVPFTFDKSNIDRFDF